MAIYHFSGKILKRSEGKNALRAAAYRSAEKMTDPRTGEVFDYTRKTGVHESLILAPANAPGWVYDRAELWKQVELSENRKDAQLARDFDMALPVELGRAQQVELLRDFVQSQFVNVGMVADINCHDLDSENPHAHVMLTMREISPAGFGKKNRDWNDQNLMEDWRAAWADQCNAALAKAGLHSIKIDHRSFERQGLDKVPTVHLGPTAAKQERAGTPTPQGDHNRTALAVNSLKLEIKLDENDLPTVRATTAPRCTTASRASAAPRASELVRELRTREPDQVFEQRDSRSLLLADAYVHGQISARVRAAREAGDKRNERIKHIETCKGALATMPRSPGDELPSWFINNLRKDQLAELKRLGVEIRAAQTADQKVVEFMSMPWYRRAWASLTGQAPTGPQPGTSVLRDEMNQRWGEARGYIRALLGSSIANAHKAIEKLESEFPEIAPKPEPKPVAKLESKQNSPEKTARPEPAPKTTPPAPVKPAQEAVKNEPEQPEVAKPTLTPKPRPKSPGMGM